MTLLCLDYSQVCNHFCLAKDPQDIELRNIDFNDNKPIVISLGNSCIVGSALNTFKIRRYSFPLDWVWPPYEGLLALFENDFQDFFNSEFLVPVYHKRLVLNTKYNISFLHDFPTFNQDGKEILIENYADFMPGFISKYSRRINRLYEVLNSKKQIFLIRARYSPIEKNPVTKENAILLRNLLLRKFPNINLMLVLLDMQDEQYKEDWNLEGIKNFFLNNTSGSFYSGGDHNTWEQIFIKLNLI